MNWLDWLGRALLVVAFAGVLVVYLLFMARAA